MSEQDPVPVPRAHNNAWRVLSNPLVLAKIGHWLPAKDICSLRSTCTLWNQTMVPNLREKLARIYVSSDLANFTNLLGQSREIPFAKFQIELADYESMQDFIGVCGKLVAVLNLHGEFDAAQLRQIVFGGQMQELSHLVLNIFDQESENQMDLVPLPPNEDRLLSTLPKLKRLDYNGHPRPAWGSLLVADIIQCAPSLETFQPEILILRDTSNVLLPFLSSLSASQDLKVLKLCFLTGPELQQLINCSRAGNLRLEYLSTGVLLQENVESLVCSNLLRDFLEVQAPTLRHLKLHIVARRVVPFRIPQMHLLRKLKLENPDEGLQFQSGFATCFPQLECLHYMECVGELGPPEELLPPEEAYTWGEAPEGLQVGVHGGVKELKVAMPAQKIRALSLLLPAVTRADLRIWRASMADCVGILEMWPNLTRLSLELVEATFETDVFLTGIDIEITRVDELRRHLKTLTTTRESLHAFAADYKTQIGIRDMAYLRYFNLSVNPVRRIGIGTALTDVGVYFGLALASPHLRNISIIGDRVNTDLLSEGASVYLRNVLGPLAEINLEPRS